MCYETCPFVFSWKNTIFATKPLNELIYEPTIIPISLLCM